MSEQATSDTDKAFLRQAIELAEESVERGGGPFGAVLVYDGEVIARAANRVTLDCDPTAHAEVLAIRAAALALGRPHLPDTILYASCEPCPMCLAAAHWAHIPRIVFAASQETADRAGFADGNIAQQLYGQTHPVRADDLGLEHIALENAAAPFLAWQEKKDRRSY